jgi:PAS domain S-box-containing protein
MTDSRKNQESLQKAHDELEVRMAQRAAELAEANEKLRLEIAEHERTEAALQESYALLRAVIEESTDAIFAKDLQGRYKMINSAGAHCRGKTPEQIVGKVDTDLFSPATADIIMQADRRILAGDATQTYEETTIEDGKVRTHLVTKGVYHGHGGQCLGIVGMARDISARKRAEEALRESEARYRDIVDTAQEGIWTTDVAGLTTYVNPRMATMLGYTVEEMQGRPLLDFIPAEQHDYITTKLQRRAAGIKEQYDFRFERRDGSDLWVIVSARPLYDADEKFAGTLAMFTDITDRKRTEAALQQSAVDAERANRAKSEFLSRMSHELRTPLNAILGFGQLLEMDPLSPEQEESVEHILKGGRHLLSLINEILDLARIESGRMALSMEPVWVGDVLQESMEMIRPLATQRGIELQGEDWEADHRYLWADRQRLKQVLLNLLSNAVKYNRSGGKVVLSTMEISAETAIAEGSVEEGSTAPATGQHGADVLFPGAAQRNVRHLRIKISDTGHGIPMEDLQRIFVSFERIEVGHSEVEGTGLGLAVAKRLMELMEGHISVRSTVGEGSEFWLELPLVEEPALQLEAVGHDPTDSSQVAVAPIETRAVLLYVEDNLANLALIRRILAGHPGIRILTAMQGGIGLRLAHEYHPDLILLDSHLPDMSGEDVLRRLQSDAATRPIPVIMLSADATPGQIQRLLNTGARSYLTKPLDVQKFLQVMEETLES